MRLRFVVPLDVDRPTGGNVYDLAVSEALGALGDEVDVVRCAPGDLAEVVGRPWSEPTLVDGLLACAQPAVVCSAPVGVLVHMPLAWGDGLTAERADELYFSEGESLRAAALVVATSEWSARYLRAHHGLHDVVVAAPGVEPAPLVAGSSPPLFVQVAALLPNKDQLTVVAALETVADLPWRARLVGDVERDPAYAEEVRRAVTAAGLDSRIELTGVLPREDSWAGADLALLPSRVETFGMVVTEALARGVPAVVGEGGAREALGLTPAGELPGVVVTPGDAPGLGLVLRRWLTDEVHRHELRRRALARRDSLAGWDTTAGLIRGALSIGRAVG